MLNNVRFNDIDSLNDLGLILSSRSISSPEIKENYVDVSGGDGSIDLTEAFGDVHYENRKIKLSFKIKDDPRNFWSIFSKVQNILHGRKFKIVFDDDEDFYYLGRISIDKWKTDKVIGSMNFDIECDPYKYWRDLTVINEHISGSKTIRLDNMRKAVFPTFNCSTSMSLVFGDKTILANKGVDFYSADIKLIEGSNWLKVNGTGDITIRYQQGSL